METGFLNKHDSEYFSSDATYEQSNGFESEGSFFSSFVNGYNNEFDDYQWVINDEENNLNDSSLNIISNETPVHQDDFNKSFNDWQQHISNLKFREDDLHNPNVFIQEERLSEIFPIGSPSINTSLPSLLDDPLNPDLLLDELAAAAAIPDSPVSPPPCETQVRIKVEPRTEQASSSVLAKLIKQEPVDFFSVDLSPPDLLESFTSGEGSSSSTAPVDTSKDLGPDNYDVVDIKVEGEEEEEEEDEVDIETVTDSMPVIEANDIASLLDQFEASERVNNLCKSKMKETKPPHRTPAPAQSTPKVPPIIIKKMNSQLKVEPKVFLASTPAPTLKVLTSTPAPTPKVLLASTPAPTPKVFLASTPAPTPKVFLASTPAPTAKVLTSTPAPSPKVLTSTPAPTPKVFLASTPAPSPKVLTSTPDPTPKVLTSTPAPTPKVRTSTPALTPKVLTSTPAPTPKVRTSTPALTPKVLTSTPAPTPVVAPRRVVSPAPSLFSVPKSGPVNKTIIDSLPQEVIDRIKKSSSKKKKMVTVVPAERLPVRGNSHMREAGASKLKVRDMTIEKKVKTEAAQMDHDYCTNENDQIPVKPSNKNSKTNAKMDCAVVQTPLPKPPVTVVVDAFCVTEEDKWVLDNEQKLTSIPTASPSPSEASSNVRNNWEKNSKRDSGLESGDVSDASESPSDKKCPPKIQMQTGESFDRIDIDVEKKDCPDARQADSADYHTEVPNPLPGINNEPEPVYEQDKNEPKKKKLNLDEYRSRRKFARLSSPVKTGTIGEAIMSNKWVQRPPKDKVEEPKPVEDKNNRFSTLEIPKEVSPKKYDEDRRRRSSRSRERTRSRYRHRSSSSSSSESRVRSSRVRVRSRDRIRRAPHRSRSRERNYRSRSSSSSSSSASRSSSSRSRSGSGSRSRSSRSSRYYGRSRSRSRSCYRRRTDSRRYTHRVSSDRGSRRSDDWSTGERQKQVEERRVIYVGQIEEGTTKAQLRERFQCFGPIVDISLHFRERGDNYGFVTFAYKGDAYKAVEHGNDNPMEPRYDICFGGRRAFCKQRYADLDSMAPQPTYSPFHQSRSNESFDSLLRAAREKILRSQKNV